jgi:hypothetical protein
VAEAPDGPAGAALPGLAFVSVVFEAEFGLLLVQARSMARYVPPAAAPEIVVIDNSRRGMPEPLRAELLDAYGPLRPAVSVLRPADIDRIPGATGWRSQQALKLLVARRLRTARYVVLDAKNHFVAPLTPDVFEAPDGRMRARFYSYEEHPLRRDLEHVLDYLGLDPDVHVPHFTATVTPFVLEVADVVALMADVEARSGRRFAREFIGRDLTEFFLVAGWLVSRGRDLEKVYEPGLDAGPTVWPRGATPDGVATATAEAAERGTPMFAVHRLALLRLDDEAARRLAEFWAGRGLFPSAETARAFLAGARAALEGELRRQRRRDLPHKVLAAPRALRRKSAPLRRRLLAGARGRR